MNRTINVEDKNAKTFNKSAERINLDEYLLDNQKTSDSGGNTGTGGNSLGSLKSDGSKRFRKEKIDYEA